MKNQPQHYARSMNLNALRTVAFIHVFILHAFGNYQQDLINYSIIGRAIFSYSYGTYTFLILSGYLATSSILREVNISGKLHVLNFYKRRILRIWPLYFTFISFVFLTFPLLSLFASSATVVANHPINYYFFLGNFDILTMGKSLYGKNLSIASTWTLSVLEQFYLIWPLLFFWIQPRFYWAIFAITLFISLGFSMLNIENTYMLRIHTLSACSSIIFGGLVAYLLNRYQDFKNVLTNLPKWLIAICYLVGFCFSLYSNKLFFGKYHYIINNVLHAIFISFVILEQRYSQYSVFKVSAIKKFAAWGKYGYGFYLFHQVGLFIVHIPFRLLHISYDNLWLTTLIAVIAFGLTLFMSYLSYKYFESKFIDLEQRFYIPNSIKKKETKETALHI